MPDPFFTGPSILSAVGSLGSSLISNIGAKQRQREADKQNIRFWNMQNKYNTPLAQMQRFKDAGLNPNLIYGKGTPGQASPVAPSKPAPYSVQNPVPPQAMLINSQIELNKANELKSLATAEKEGALSKEIQALLGGKIRQYDVTNDLNALKLDIGNATKQNQINKIVAESNTARFTENIQAMSSDYANKGLKPDSIGIIMNSLGLSPNNPEDQKIMKGLIYTWYGSNVFKNLAGPIKTVLDKFFKNKK
jgi:hypothetical protein